MITAEPPPPMNAGSVNLYTKEYYELTKRALKPGGIVSQWIPLHSQTETNVYQSFRTFYESFPYVMAWYPVRSHLILIGSNQPININFQNVAERLQNPVINKIMRDIEFGTPYSFLGSIWFLKNELKRLSSGESIISDNNPSLEFFLEDPRAMSEDGVNRIIESRSSFEDAYEKITQSSYFLSKDQKATFKKHWDSRLSRAYARKSFILGLMSVDPNESIAHYRKAISHDVFHKKAHYNLGNALLKKGNTNEAISHYKTDIKLNPDFAQAHNNLGNALLKKGNTSEAIVHYKRAIEIKPDHADAHNNLGVALMNKGNTSEAIVHYKRAIEIKPDHASAHDNLKLAQSK